MTDTKLGMAPLLGDYGGLKTFGPGVHLLELWSNVGLVEADDGVVLFDCGFEFTGPRIVEELRRLTDKPVAYIIYGHGHADHAFGAAAVLADAEARGYPRPIIVAHEGVARRFDRYREMQGYHEHINRIQFDIPETLPAFARNYIYPNLTYRDAMSFRRGGLTFELRHARGETDDTTWMYVPERRAAFVSDLWVWSCPNIGNPFKVQRYEVEWARALEEIAARRPAVLLPGHGPALEGDDLIAQACLTVAGALRYLHDQVVAMLNAGRWQEEVLHEFQWPEEYANSPWLAPVYGHPYFIVQAILRRYHGWYDGNPSHLFPARAAEVAAEVAALAGTDKLLDRARELEGKGEFQLALHLADFVIEAGAAGAGPARALKIKLLEALGQKEKSLIARNIYLVSAKRMKK